MAHPYLKNEAASVSEIPKSEMEFFPYTQEVSTE